MAEDAILKIVL